MEDSGDLPSDPTELQTVIEEAESRLATLQEKVAQETCKLERYKVHMYTIYGYCRAKCCSKGYIEGRATQ